MLALGPPLTITTSIGELVDQSKTFPLTLMLPPKLLFPKEVLPWRTGSILTDLSPDATSEHLGSPSSLVTVGLSAEATPVKASAATMVLQDANAARRDARLVG